MRPVGREGGGARGGIVQPWRSVISTIALLYIKMCMQFGGTMGERMKSVYGAFCSRHNDALQLYKALLKSDVTFQEFIKVSTLE